MFSVYDIARQISLKGFNIDVIDYQLKLELSHYDLVFGFGEQFQRQIELNQAEQTIHYAAGMHVEVQNGNTTERLLHFKNRHGLYFPLNPVE